MNQERRQSILREAIKDAELLAQVPPVVAAGFGVLALRRLGDVLTVACFPRANRQALRLLREVLEVEIVATPFDDALLHEALRSAYFSGDRTVNFPTFLDAAFLEDPRSVDLLRQEKVETLEPPLLALPPDRLVLCTLSHRSRLTNLDAPRLGGALPNPERTRLQLAPLPDAGWRREGARVHVYLPDGELPPAARLVLTEYRFSEHLRTHGGSRLAEHEARTRAVDSLPAVIHPTEVQLVRIEADGSLGLHAYDRLAVFPPGRPGRVELAYHFLSYGNRMHRSIWLDIHDVECVARDEVHVHAQAAPWGVRELALWFGLQQE